MKESTRVSTPQVRRNIPAFPARRFYGFLCGLPGDRAFLPPSPAGLPCRLDASVEASGRHNFSVRIRRIRLMRQTRPSHPAPNVRDDREASLLSGAGRGELLKVICPTAQAESWQAPIDRFAPASGNPIGHGPCPLRGQGETFQSPFDMKEAINRRAAFRVCTDELE